MRFTDIELPSTPLPYMMSYAQQAEDVVIRRGLWGLERGFYVDIGAAFPAQDSVTNYFYQRGWHGINIEPQPEIFGELEAARPRDINLQLAIARDVGQKTLKIYPNAWGFASIDRDTNSAHAENGLDVRDVIVEARPLTQVLEEHAPGRINFLKIDVEGAEKEVLETAELEKWMPDIVVVEATKPGSRELNIEWEHIILAAGYRMALFDGLNRFYSASPAICERIATPANTFDSYVPYRWWSRMSKENQKELLKGKQLDSDFEVAK